MRSIMRKWRNKNVRQRSSYSDFRIFGSQGKGTVVKQLLQEYDYGLSISATTRSPREGEQDGREYFFKTKEEFEKMIREHQLIEYAQYVGNYYGTPKEYVVQQLERQRQLFLKLKCRERFVSCEILPGGKSDLSDTANGG